MKRLPILKTNNHHERWLKECDVKKCTHYNAKDSMLMLLISLNVSC